MKCWEEIIGLIDSIIDNIDYIQNKMIYHALEFKSYHESLSDEDVEKIYKLLEEITKIV